VVPGGQPCPAARALPRATSYELDPVMGRVQHRRHGVRWPRLSTTTWLAAEWGHPSDNLSRAISSRRPPDYYPLSAPSAIPAGAEKAVGGTRLCSTAMIKGRTKSQGVPRAPRTSFNTRRAFDSTVRAHGPAVRVRNPPPWATAMLGRFRLEQIVNCAGSNAWIDGGRACATYRQAPAYTGFAAKSWCGRANGPTKPRAVRHALFAASRTRIGLSLGAVGEKTWGFPAGRGCFKGQADHALLAGPRQPTSWKTLLFKNQLPGPSFTRQEPRWNARCWRCTPKVRDKLALHRHASSSETPGNREFASSTRPGRWSESPRDREPLLHPVHGGGGR